MRFRLRKKKKKKKRQNFKDIELEKKIKIKFKMAAKTFFSIEIFQNDNSSKNSLYVFLSKIYNFYRKTFFKTSKWRISQNGNFLKNIFLRC
jgi:hypothetical protein